MTARRIRIAAIVTAAALFLVWAFRPSPAPADVATIQRGPLQVTIDEEGETRVRDRYVVSAPLPGRMQRIMLEPGDRVEADRTVLVLFEPADPGLLDARTRAEVEARVRAADSAVGGARADEERVKAELEFARTERQRYRDLMAAGLVSHERLDIAERQVRALEEMLRSAEFAVRTAEHQLEVARASLLQARGPGRPGTAIEIRSPVDGVVLRRFQQSETVLPTGQPLLEVGDLSQLEVVADLLSTEAVRVEIGQPVLIEQWGGDRVIRGRVTRIEPSGFTKVSALGVEEQRVNVVIDFEEPRDAWSALGDGYRVEVRVVVWSRDDVLKVPTSALFRQDGEWALYRVENGRAVRRSVEIGQRSGLEAEVLAGLEAGDRVIVYPSDAIEDGVRVGPRS